MAQMLDSLLSTGRPDGAQPLASAWPTWAALMCAEKSGWRICLSVLLINTHSHNELAYHFDHEKLELPAGRKGNCLQLLRETVTVPQKVKC